MSKHRLLCAAVDKLLDILLSTQMPYVSTVELPDELKSSKGIKEEVHEIDGSGAPTMQTIEESPRAYVDVRVLLAEVLAGQGLALAAADLGRQDFIRIEGGTIPDQCSAFFLMDNRIPPYAARALTDTPLCVVIHANAELPSNYNESCANALCVHVFRIRDLADITNDCLSEIEQRVSAIRAAAVSMAISELGGAVNAADAAKAALNADPSKVEDYAATEQDALFEAATAKILHP